MAYPTPSAARTGPLGELGMARPRQAIVRSRPDSPSSPTYPNPPGFREMQRWLDAGVTPAQLFRAATIANAEFFGLQEGIGRAEEGKRAGLLSITKTPMGGVSAFHAFDVVIVGGRIFPRSESPAKNTQRN